jgi:hypothetical protein
MIHIPLTQDRFALVDDDRATVEQFSWLLLSVADGGNRYAVRRRSRTEAGPRAQLMHSLLTGWPMTDHINGNGLDNRRRNLRPATRQENMRNRRKLHAGTSKYKGVYLQEGRWIAKIRVLGKSQTYLGSFADEMSAALAYDAAARLQFGAFAALNFPGPGEQSALPA